MKGIRTLESIKAYCQTYHNLLPHQIRVAVGLSGGVDSAVSAHLLKQAGFALQGVFMRNWDSQDLANPIGVCSSDADFSDARKVADHLQIPITKVDYVKEYWSDVFEPFIKQYEQGITPNPDINCNRKIKFDKFLNHCRTKLNCHFVATGHYARIYDEPLPEPFPLHSSSLFTPQLSSKLYRGVDSTKDQAYFLSGINSHTLPHILFPVGHLPKSQVRELASSISLHNSSKKDSYGICFVGANNNFQTFLTNFIEHKPGDFVTLDGNVLPWVRHNGIHSHTVGQRIKLNGGKESADKWYVVGKNVDRNELVVGKGWDNPGLFCDEVRSKEFNWIRRLKGRKEKGLRYQIRNLQEARDCEVEIMEGEEKEKEKEVRVKFGKAQRGCARGQVVVLFDGEECLGGGTITDVGPSYYEMKKELDQGYSS